MPIHFQGRLDWRGGLSEAHPTARQLLDAPFENLSPSKTGDDVYRRLAHVREALAKTGSNVVLEISPHGGHGIDVLPYAIPPSPGADADSPAVTPENSTGEPQGQLKGPAEANQNPLVRLRDNLRDKALAAVGAQATAASPPAATEPRFIVVSRDHEMGPELMDSPERARIWAEHVAKRLYQLGNNVPQGFPDATEPLPLALPSPPQPPIPVPHYARIHVQGDKTPLVKRFRQDPRIQAVLRETGANFRILMRDFPHDRETFRVMACASPPLEQGSFLHLVVRPKAGPVLLRHEGDLDTVVETVVRDLRDLAKIVQPCDRMVTVWPDDPESGGLDRITEPLSAISGTPTGVRAMLRSLLGNSRS